MSNDLMLCTLTTTLVSSRKPKFESTDELPALPPTVTTDIKLTPLFSGFGAGRAVSPDALHVKVFKLPYCYALPMHI